ncbi:hypothetical protein, partial [Salmonella enterica]|uniref:hypothetical protein n=1 Tax=Salmonella enterica TaxID=28901 RepID=UPI000B1D6BCE
SGLAYRQKIKGVAMLYGITKMRVGSMLKVYVICNNALVQKQYVIANRTERVQWFMLTTGLKIALTRDTR